MLQESLDLRAEADELHAFLQTLAPEAWERPTAFKQWTPWDVVAHLHYFDQASLKALSGGPEFGVMQRELIDAMVSGRSLSELARVAYAGVGPAELTERWIATCTDMATQLGESEPKRRLPWFGPDMGVRMFTTARLMETWAHGQEIYDLVGATRTPTDRLRNIATLGVKTFGWTFVNRKLEIPGAPPYVRLVSPSGEIWEWNEPNERECVRGDALDFCHVVTQGRNLADTGLEVVGEVATAWMAIAQCFAGGAADPPAPGERTGA
jgi:uncharacterized protein (TIGR03084 family)